MEMEFKALDSFKLHLPEKSALFLIQGETFLADPEDEGVAEYLTDLHKLGLVDVEDVDSEDLAESTVFSQHQDGEASGASSESEEEGDDNASNGDSGAGESDSAGATGSQANAGDSANPKKLSAEEKRAALDAKRAELAASKKK